MVLDCLVLELGFQLGEGNRVVLVTQTSSIKS